VDGIVVMAYTNTAGGGPVQPSFDGIEQINIELAGTQAEFARAATFTVVTKSGTNQFHGSAFHQYNGNRLNARNFFSTTVPFRVYHDFGASLGGPIRKNKTFFFTDYEGSRESATAVLVCNTPLVPWRSGDFSTGVSKAILDPTTGQPFPSSRIPASRISPVSQKTQDFFYPLPNFGAAGLQSGNWRGQLPAHGYTHFDHVDGRIDHNLSEHDLIFGRFSYRRLPVIGQNNNLPPAGHYDELRNGISGVVSWSHSFSPSLINEFRTGMARMRDATTPSLNGYEIIKQIGMQGIGVGEPIHAEPVFNVTGITTTAQTVTNGDNALNVSTNFEFTDNLSMSRGSHFLKFGADVIRDQFSNRGFPDDMYGTYNFTGAYTGFGYADLLLGIPQTTSRTIPTPQSYLRGTIWSFYAQDQYKLSRRLTLNFGLRWELQGPYFDKFGDLYTFERQNGSIIVPSTARINPLYPKNIPIRTASEAGYPTALVNFDKNNLYPRFGFAYKPFSNNLTVIRGGYGIYGNTIYGAAAGKLLGGPFAGSEAFTNSITNGVPLFSFPNPFLSVGATATQNVFGINRNLKTPYSQQFNLTVERQVGQIGIRVAFIGTRSVDLVYASNINQPRPSTIPFTASRRIYPLYNVITWYDNGGSQQYNALQVSASKTYGKNLFFNSGWTWAKDLTDTQNNANTFTGPTIQNAYDRRAERGNNVLTRPHRIYATAVYALPIGHGQRLLAHTSRLVNGILGGWSTSWISEMQTGQYFTPTYSGFDPSNTNNFGPSTSFVARPDRIGSGKLSAGQSIYHFFDASAFKVPGCPDTTPLCTNPANIGRFGNSGVNVLRGPKAVNFNFAAIKQFHIGERARVLFRMLATNIFNHPSFSNPQANISSPGTVGTITSIFGEQTGEATRQIHFNLRLEF
jgi:hypothetical protein